jgi:hypothetical protein
MDKWTLKQVQGDVGDEEMAGRQRTEGDVDYDAKPTTRPLLRPQPYYGGGG